MHQRRLPFNLFLVLIFALAACAPSTSQPTDDPSLPFQSTRGPLEGDAETVVQILHASDQEGAVAAIEDAPRFSSVINGLEGDYGLTLILSSGDLYIPGPFFSATSGSADIRINNAVGVQAAAFGNHEFDLGTDTIEDLIAADEEDGYPGATFPYLSTNLDFSGSNLGDFVVPDGQEASSVPNSIAGSVVITEGGETFGVVGVTTPQLPSISSPGDVAVSPRNPQDMQALAQIVQPAIDDLTSQGVNKIIVLAHLQQLENEIDLAQMLSGVDIVIAGGSDTLLATPNNRLRQGDERRGNYPLLYTNASGEPVALVNTSREYRYVGRLIAGFNSAGVLVNIGEESGAYPTDEQGVAETGDEAPADGVLEAVADVRTVIEELDGEVFGSTEVYLNGLREAVRTQETNLGNLTADANLAVARETDPDTAVSIKNGGGIRAAIGAVLPGDTGERVPPRANPLTDKQEGDISQLDIQNALRFDNDLTLLTLTARELKQILEHGVAATEPGATPGQFPQVGGLAFSFDPSLPPSEVDEEGNVVSEGQRVQNVVLLDDSGEVKDVIVENGVVVGDPERPIRTVTLGFLADGGDSYPFPDTNRQDLDTAEQAALQEYLGEVSPVTQPDTDIAEDTRIQNLSEREDTVLPAGMAK